ncbi:hypothetical protein P168DRAFT_285242 [Aspergillus campestris IBT 28561]|uniref:Nucleoside phosphorylase domain-containing protein n=1 Tax=Aspergillus campestris (strain IBT 28561) TaxID=1392248 RepID=A0A2I1CSG0_ASPC2|nr:uncharacterized protein P168DRAFT_285242 [Aspergillus campestris IBT 28561]PKY00566.1 hypothetical protein P168DRAFT_285242 [Aspergillus campestris IBT 28561]
MDGARPLRHSTSTNWLQRVHHQPLTDEIPHPNRFRWGWLCASGSDYKAVLRVLDHCFTTSGHEEVQHSKGYTLGHIGRHNLVICPPNYSQTCLSLDAENMQLAYPSIEQFLIVGIASGMATPDLDVRLGDIIIGERAFSYDVQTGIYGDTYGPRNVALEQTCRALNTKILLREGGVQDFVKKVVQTQPSWFQRPENRDILFESNYLHTSSCKCLEEATSNISEGIVRPDRSPDKLIQVHYGTIASLSQDLEDTQLRDCLSFGKNVLCVDKQSASTMEKVNCLPVLGICNYGDSHQYEYWNNYASLTAVICAKELLDCIELLPITNTANGIDGETPVSAAITKPIDPEVDLINEIKNDLKIVEDKIHNCHQKSDAVFKFANCRDQDIKAEVAALKLAERKCKQDLEELRQKIKNEMQQNYVSKPEWNTLKKRISKDTQRIRLSEVSMKLMWGMAQIIRAAGKAVDKMMSKHAAEIPENVRNADSSPSSGQFDPHKVIQSCPRPPGQANGEQLPEHISNHEDDHEGSFPPTSPQHESAQIVPKFYSVTPKTPQGAFLQHQITRSEYQSNISSPILEGNGLLSPAATNSQTSLPHSPIRISTEGRDFSEPNPLSNKPQNCPDMIAPKTKHMC